MNNLLTPKLKICSLCGRGIMTNPKISTGKGMRPHKCSHGKWCDRGKRIYLINLGKDSSVLYCKRIFHCEGREVYYNGKSEPAKIQFRKDFHRKSRGD